MVPATQGAATAQVGHLSLPVLVYAAQRAEGGAGAGWYRQHRDGLQLRWTTFHCLRWCTLPKQPPVACLSAMLGCIAAACRLVSHTCV